MIHLFPQRMRYSDMKLYMGLNEKMLKYNIQQEITIDTTKNAIGLIQGGTGSGKTYMLKRLLAYVEYIAELQGMDVITFLLDFKGDDCFSAFNNCEHYYSYMNCIDGLNNFHSIMTERQQGNSDRSFCLLCFDEYAAFLDSLPDKKTENEVRSKIASLVLMQRSFHMATVFCLQAGYSETFNKIRNNISFVMSMGHLTRELKTMFYGSVADEVNQDKLQGHGSLIIDGCQLYDVVIPQITNTEKLDQYITKLLNRTLPSNDASPPSA